MKNTVVIFLLFLLSGAARAQTFDEWFRQRETQKEYLVQQIAALQAYAGTLRQGYALLHEGISTVQQIKNGDLGLHQAFFQSHALVPLSVRQSAKVADILSWHTAILRDLSAAVHLLGQQEHLPPDLTAYLEQVRAQVSKACSRDTESLWLLLTANALDLSEGERHAQLEVLYRAAQDRYRFTGQFLQQARLLALQHGQTKGELPQLQSLHGLH